MIDELIILNSDGIPLFYYNFHRSKRLDDDYVLIASFLDQLARFTKASLEKDLNVLEWENFAYFFYREKEPDIELFIKCDSSRFYNLNIIKKPVDMIAKHLLYKFRIKFKEDLENFQGETSKFKGFSNEIEEMFKKI